MEKSQAQQDRYCRVSQGEPKKVDPAETKQKVAFPELGFRVGHWGEFGQRI